LTGVRSVRTASGLEVPVDSLVELARKVDTKEITQEQAQAALRLLAGGDAPAGSTDGDDSAADVVDEEDLAEVLAEAEAVLEDLDG